MRVRTSWFFMAAAGVLALAQSASACHGCKQTPCVVAQPAYQCVTQMVPQTVYKTHKRIELETVQQTIMTRVAHTTYVERPRMVCKPVWDTTYVQRQVVTCRPVSTTSYVDQQYTVCTPVSSTRQITEYCMQPYTQLVTVAAKSCGLCGHGKHSGGCTTVAKTCYTPVPVVRNVVETHMVSQVYTRQVPVVSTQFIQDVKVENVPVRSCRMVQEWVTDRIPVTTFECVPKVITRQIPHTVCETVAETCYKAVKTMVPVVYAPAPAPVYAPAPSMQAAPSTQS